MDSMMKCIPDGYMEKSNMGRTITYDSHGRDITCMKEFDALKYPYQECDMEDCEEREDYEETKSRKQIQFETQRYSESSHS